MKFSSILPGAGERTSARPALPLPILAGFECSTHRRADGLRLDLVESTAHDELAAHDFRRVRSLGIRTVREGLRWHRIEPERGRQSWESLDRIRLAAEQTGIEVIWDLMHFGLPDWVNPFHPDFPCWFAEFAGAAAMRMGPAPLIIPINEISFHAWGAGEVGFMAPWARNRGVELKRALCKAAIAAIEVIRTVQPTAVVLSTEPMIKVHAAADGSDAEEAAHLDAAQHEALDALLGRLWPELGGHESAIDIVGVNHYPHSQWTVDRTTVPWRQPEAASLSGLLIAMHDRYGKPILLAETGCEGDDRLAWFHYVKASCEEAVHQGVAITGICLYPFLSHIGWDGERYCPNGVFCGVSRERPAHLPLAAAIAETLAHARPPFSLTRVSAEQEWNLGCEVTLTSNQQKELFP